MNKEKCPFAKKCGGCQYQGMEYEEQLKEKEKYVRSTLKEFGKPEPIVGMEDPYFYRNKVHSVFKHHRSGDVIAGIYEEGSHRIVPVTECQIENQEADAVIQTIRKLAKSFKIKIYNEDSEFGLLRHVLIRTGHATGEMLVVLVAASPVFPSKNNFVKALRKEHPSITSVVLNVNNKRTNMVLGDRNITLYGKGYIEDVLCDCRFKISPNSFYQVNPVQTEILYKKAIKMAKLTGKERVVDAYSGIGTIGLIAASQAKEVIGVELNKDAVRDAVGNAKRNGIKNIQFYQEDAGKFLVSMAEQGEKVDVVFMDPPRAGSDEAFLGSIVTISPARVVYVSCNPQTLARDLLYMKKNGYKVERICPVDMFPFTNHVETVVLMSRVNN
ncbi:MAG: 23S rRNA (uracil(1939)-C(5))-methyltransferase RlmD [Clostridia bacterium]|nr:23S rRNA (uracil(1939)-C(5))-methyltransferase RlmD [Clostridia bacterium]